MKPARGFIALISVVVIASVLLGAAATLSQGVFFTRFDGLNAEYQQIARSLAEGCLHAGELKLADNFDYTVSGDPAYDATQGGVPISVGQLYGKDVACLLTAPTTTPSTRAHQRTFTVVANGSFSGSFTTLAEEVKVTDPNVPTGRMDALVVPGVVHQRD